MSGNVFECYVDVCAFFIHFRLAFAYVEHASGTSASASAHTAHEVEPKEDEQQYGAETEQNVEQVVAALVLIVQLTLEFSRFLFRLHECFDLVDASEFSCYKRAFAGVLRSLLEHVAYVLWVDIHLQGALVLVYHYFRGVSFIDVSLEFVVGNFPACASAYGVSAKEVHAHESEQHEHVNPAHAEFRLLVVFILFHFVRWCFAVKNPLQLLCVFERLSVYIWKPCKLGVFPEVF